MTTLLERDICLQAPTDLASVLLRGSCFSPLDAVRVLLEILERLGKDTDMQQVRRLIELGHESLLAAENSVSFAEAAKLVLEQKKHCSIRTQRDIRQTNNALMRCEKGLAERPMRSINSAECERILHQAYAHSPARFIKARGNLSGVFSFALRRGWCSENPVKLIPIPKVKERTIAPLSLAEVQSLLRTGMHVAHRPCLAALALMLYAGVRPEEMRRLSWQDIDWEEGELYMAPRHTKTGGGRHVPLCRPLLRLLRREYQGKEASDAICPPRWRERWQYLRQAAGFSSWVPDILRHSFASYHAKHYKDLPRLQLAMGHRDCQLLLTRYVNLRGITKQAAATFWKMQHFAKKID